MDVERVGNIRVEKALGQGGMGTVYVGFDETLQRKVALKVIRKDKRLPTFVRERFLREARILSKLEHRNICRIYDYIEHDDEEYLVLELIDGASLQEPRLLESFDDTKRLDIALQIAGALLAAHEKNIVHRDLKPDNVMYTKAGVVKVLDFGLARGAETIASDTPEDELEVRPDDPDASVAPAPQLTAGQVLGSTTETFGTGFLTEVGSVMGSPQYMSPEQAIGARITTASDMYSFGLLLQWLYEGEPPYDPSLSLVEVLMLARDAKSRALVRTAAPVAHLIEMLKSKAPAARPTAREMLRSLEHIREAPRRRRTRFLTGGLLLGAIIAGVKYTVDLKDEKERTEESRDRAQNLIAFMLGDLREKLEPIAQLPILDDASDRALEYMSTLELDDLNEHDLLMWSKTLYGIGLVRIEQGDLPEAMTAFQESLLFARQLALATDDGSDAVEQIGLSHFGVASVHYYQGELEQALTGYESSRDMAAELVSREPTNSAWLQELADEEVNIGFVLAGLGRPDEAHKNLVRQLEAHRQFVASDTTDVDYRWELAKVHLMLGPLEEERGNLKQAQVHYQDAENLMVGLVDKQSSAQLWLHDLALSRTYLGIVQEFRGQLDTAEGTLRSALETAKALENWDATNANWHDLRASAQRNLGHLYVKVGRLPEALPLLQESRTQFDELAASDETHRRWRREAASSQIAMGRWSLANGNLIEALNHVQSAERKLAMLVADDANDEALQITLSECRLFCGRVLVEHGRNQDASRKWRDALEMIEPIAKQTKSASVLSTYCLALTRLGETEKALPIRAELESQGYFSQALNDPLAPR